MKKTLFAALAVLALAAPSFADCPPDSVVVTKSGYYGAVNGETFHAMNRAIDQSGEDRGAALNRLLSEGAVVALPAGRQSCIVTDNFYSYARFVLVPGLQAPVWVSVTAVSPVR